MDSWVKGNSLRSMVEGPLTPREANLTIGEIFQDGEWNWDIISFELPRQIKDEICAIPMQLYGEKKDALMWKFSQDGEFNMALAYALTNPQETNPQPFMGNWVWKLDIWPKISSFLWLCHHNNVPSDKSWQQEVSTIAQHVLMQKSRRDNSPSAKELPLCCYLLELNQNALISIKPWPP